MAQHTYTDEAEQVTALAPVPDSDLDRLAREAREAHRDAEAAWETAKERAARCGEILREAKGRLPHGEWLPWLATTEIPERTAQRYMRFAERAKSANVSDLRISDAVERARERPVRPSDLQEKWRRLERVITGRSMTTYRAGRQTVQDRIAWHEAELERLTILLADLGRWDERWRQTRLGEG
jgi:hypothetical protein